MDQMLHVSSNPHVRDKMTTSKIMQLVALALLPTTLFGIYNFGVRALLVVVITVASSVFFEWIYDKLMHKKNTITDFSAVVTGLLLALNMPASIPLWMPVLGSAFAIIVVKQLFGGLGQNFMNPALAARCFLLTSFALFMNNFSSAKLGFDSLTGATPLAQLRAGETVDLASLVIGRIPGTIGEVSVIALLIGAIYMVVRKVISPVIPVTYLATAAVLSALLGRDPLMDILSGGLLLGAIFMATDYTTSPINFSARVIYAVGCGVLTILIRQFASLPEGVSYSIVLMNILVPLIERVAKPQTFGKMKAKKAGDAK